jgi:hypothetical protein
LSKHSALQSSIRCHPAQDAQQQMGALPSAANSFSLPHLPPPTSFSSSRRSTLAVRQANSSSVSPPLLRVPSIVNPRRPALFLPSRPASSSRSSLLALPPAFLLASSFFLVRCRTGVSGLTGRGSLWHGRGRSVDFPAVKKEELGTFSPSPSSLPPP